jgi:outer membrane receptor protein involved in Fe transport
VKRGGVTAPGATVLERPPAPEIGAMVGTVLPGPGNVIGLVAGAAIGGAVGIVTSGAVDSIFENGWDLGAAWDNGWRDLADTGLVIGDLAVQGASAAGEAISTVGDGLSDAWDSIFG